jgi:uncharacterized membrane protein
MIRAVGWLCVVALGISAHVFDNDGLRGACALSVFALLALTAPASLRTLIVVLGLSAVAILVAFGSSALFDALPALIAAFVAYLFARTLLPGRAPLIARAIVSIDGAHWLDEANVRRYARRLTWIWAVYQTLLALVATLAAMHVAGVPNPRVFGALLPLAVAALFIVEFFARPFLLPNVPRHRLISFARRLILAWPQLLDDTPRA